MFASQYPAGWVLINIHWMHTLVSFKWEAVSPLLYFWCHNLLRTVYTSCASYWNLGLKAIRLELVLRKLCTFKLNLDTFWPKIKFFTSPKFENYCAKVRQFYSVVMPFYFQVIYAFITEMKCIICGEPETATGTGRGLTSRGFQFLKLYSFCPKIKPFLLRS